MRESGMTTGAGAAGLSSCTAITGAIMR